MNALLAAPEIAVFIGVLLAIALLIRHAIAEWRDHRAFVRQLRAQEERLSALTHIRG